MPADNLFFTSRSRSGFLISLLILIACVYLFTATGRAVMDDGDAIHAHVAQNMAITGDWVTPYANNVRFFDKPPMIYWTMAISFRVFGINEFAVRFPSVCAVVAISLLLFFLGQKAGEPFAGFIAGSAFALCIGTFLFTSSAFPDIFFLFFLTLAVTAFYVWHQDKRNPAVPALLFYTAAAGAVLSKGLMGLAFPAAITFLFLIWSRNLRRLQHFHILKGTLLFLLLAAPWHILAAIRNPGFLWYYFVHEQFLRFLGKRHWMDYESLSRPIFWTLVLAWLFPWSVFLPAVRHLWRSLDSWGDETRSAIRLCFCWALVILVFFSVAPRIEHYSMPIFPPIAILVGMVLSSEGVAASRARKTAARGFAFLGILGATAALILVTGGLLSAFGVFGGAGQSKAASPTHLQAYKHYFEPLFKMPPNIIAGLITPLVGVLAVMAAGFAGAWIFERRNRRLAAILAINLTMAGFCFFAWQSLGICEGFISSRQFGQNLNRLYQPGDAAVVIGDFETANSVNFYAPAVPLYVYEGSAALLILGMSYPDAPQMLLKPESFAEIWEGDGRIFLLAPEDRVPSLKLKSAWPVLRSSGRVLICNQKIEK